MGRERPHQRPWSQTPRRRLPWRLQRHPGPRTTEQAKPRTRENSKQAEVIRMLQRPRAQPSRQICDATGWQAHTVRGTFAEPSRRSSA
jgi:hypothetical protein